MADSVIGALRVLLGVDTAAFSTGLKGAEKSLDSFGSSFKGLAAKLSITAVAAKFTFDIKKMIDAADEIGKASQKFGVPVEQLSALKYAAELADVSFESLGKGLGKLSKAMLENAANPAGEAAKNFQALGISATNASGQLRPTQEVFGDIAEKFSRMEDGAAKTAMAIRVFGKSGAELIPLLNEGRAGIRTLTDEARELGVVIDGSTAKAAERFNDNLKRLHAIQQGVALIMAQQLLPALNEVTEAFLRFGKDQGGAAAFAKAISDLIRTTIDEMRIFVIATEYMTKSWMVFKEIVTTTNWEAMKAKFQELIELPAKFQQAIANMKGGFDVDWFAGMRTSLPAAKKGFDDIKISALGAKNALDSFIESQGKSITRQQAEAATMNMVLGVRERSKLLMEADTIAKENNLKITAAQAAQLELLGQRAEAAAIHMAGAKMSQENLTAWDLYVQKVNEANLVMAKHPELADAAKAASLKAAATMIESYGNVLATAAGGFADFFKTFSKGNKEMFIIGKAFSISQALINTLVGATKAYATLPPPLGAIAAAATIAAGMAMVAKIVAEKPSTGMALGGAFQVGGAGGVDSQMVPIMATPGERVHVEQNKYGDTAGGKTLTIAGIKPKDYYTGDVLRDFVDNLNQAIGDGLKIKMA